MHWPVAFGKDLDGKIVKTPKDKDGNVIVDKGLTENHIPTWQAMEKLVDAGKVKSIGISNFNIRRTEALLKGVGRIHGQDHARSDEFRIYRPASSQPSTKLSSTSTTLSLNCLNGRRRTVSF